MPGDYPPPGGWMARCPVCNTLDTEKIDGDHSRYNGEWQCLADNCGEVWEAE